MLKKIGQSFLLYLIIGMVLGVVEYVLIQDNTVSDLSSLLQAFFNKSVLWIIIIVWGADVIRIYRERNQVINN